MKTSKSYKPIVGGGRILFALLLLVLGLVSSANGQNQKSKSEVKSTKKLVTPFAPPSELEPEGPGDCTFEERGEPRQFNWMPITTPGGNVIHRLWLGRDPELLINEKFMVGINQSSPTSILDVHYPRNENSSAAFGLSVTSGTCSKVGLVTGDKFPSWVGSYSPSGDFPLGQPFQIRAGNSGDGVWADWGIGTFIHLDPEKENIGINNNAPQATLDVNGNAIINQSIQIGTGATVGYPPSSNPPTNGMIVNGNVGIGTENPETKLTLHGFGPAQSFNKLLTLSNGYQSGFLNEPTISLTNGLDQNNTNHYCWNIGGRVAGGPGYFRISRQNGSTTDEYLRILDNGKVIIGTNTPGVTNLFQNWKLAVDGLINSKEVVVTPTSTWGDYVFEEGYQLPDLLELEKWIKIEKHLPEIPTAAEVKENGLQLGELQVVLVKKIEELTLLLIEQRKEIDALKIRINQTTK
jgi:hypothetical protein